MDKITLSSGKGMTANPLMLLAASTVDRTDIVGLSVSTPQQRLEYLVYGYLREFLENDHKIYLANGFRDIFLNYVGFKIFETFPTKLLNTDQQKVLMQTLHKTCPMNPRFLTLKLLFRASEHGYRSSAFHDRCDNIKNTVVIIRTNDDKLFLGGYTSIPWSIDSKFHSDFDAFIFMINQAEYRQFVKVCGIKDTNYAVYHHRNYGPCFGNGDIRITNKCNKSKITLTKSNSYHYLSLHGDNDTQLIAQDYEVYQLF